MKSLWRRWSRYIWGLGIAILLQVGMLGMAHAATITGTGYIYTSVGGGSGGTASGVPATSAGLSYPMSVAVDGAGNVYVVDGDNGLIRVVAGKNETLFGQTMIKGDIYTIAGGGSSNGYTATNVAATSETLYSPTGIAVDSAGNVYFAEDGGLNLLRVVAASNETLFGQSMTQGDIYTIASGLNSPVGVAVDGTGNVYVADTYNNVIQMVAAESGENLFCNGTASSSNCLVYGSTAGNMYTIAGGGSSGTGSAILATSAGLNKPYGVAVDGTGNVYIADTYNQIIRVVAGTSETLFGQSMQPGYIYTVAGGGSSDSNGVAATTEQLSDPFGVAVDSAGNVYIADYGFDEIQAVAAANETLLGQSMTAGDIYTIAGTLGKAGYTGDGGPATAAELNSPNDVTVDGAGDVYIADTNNNVIREVTWQVPTVTGISTTSGPTSGGTSVTITGTGLNVATAVYFGSDPASFTLGTATSLTAVAPAEAAGTVDITVANPGGTRSATSSADQYTYVAAPTVTGISPSEGPASGGTSVTITGSNFASGATVDFGTNTATNVTVNSSTSLTATAPAGSGTVDVTVTTVGGTSATGSADQYTYVAAPTVTGVSPSSGPLAGGTTVTVSGSGFMVNSSSVVAAVYFGSEQASSYSVSSVGSLTAVAPAEAAGTVDITVVSTGGTSATGSADQYTYVAVPTVTGISPSEGPASGGTSVTITGSNFASGATVDFGTNAAMNVTVNSSTSLTATAPAGSGTVDVTVTTVGGTSATGSAERFIYLTPATVSLAVAPATATPGGPVTVTGAVYDARGVAIPGATVDVALNAGSSVAAITDSSGGYTAQLTAPTSDGSYTVTATVAGANPAVTAGVKLTVVGGAVTIRVVPESMPVDGQAQVSGTVTDGGGPLAGYTVDLGMSSGTGSAGSLSSTTVTTDVYGDYSAVFTAPAQSGAVTVTATVYGTVYQAQAVILVTPQAATVNGADEVAATGGSATASYGETSESGTGSGVLSVAQYGGDPAGIAPSGAAGYFDAALSTGNTFSSVTITECGVSANDTLDWWDPAADSGAGAWQAVSPAATYDAGCLSLTVTADTSPSLSDLDGTVFAVAAQTNSGSSGGSVGGGGGSISIPVSTPVVTGISPTAGTAGTTVNISGSGFTGATAVDFGPNAAQSFTVESDTQITAVAPAGTGTVDVTVATSGGTSATGSADQFTYQPAPCTASFTDVPASYWAHQAILTLACKGIIAGFPDGTFRPDASVTRAQFVTMLVRTLGLKLGAGNTPFTDVAPTAWYAPSVAAAEQAGIVAGISPDQFGPNEPITREEMAVLLAHVLGSPATPGSPLQFTDAAAIAPWAESAVQEVVGAGLMTGFPNGTFQPTGVSTRAQAAAVLSQYLAYAAKK